MSCPMNFKLLILCAMATGLLVFSCKEKVPSTPTTAPAQSTASLSSTKPGTATPSPATKGAATAPSTGLLQQREPSLVMSKEKIGITECDEYLDKSTRCIEDKVPASSRPKMILGLNATRQEWRKVADSAQDRERLTMACRLALKNAKKAMTMFNCEW